MTKFIDKTGEKEVIKKTEFVNFINMDGEISNASKNPEEFDNVELIDRKNNVDKFDLFLAYNDESKSKWRYLGHAGDEFK